MAHVYADRILDTSTTTGTGDFTVSGTGVTGYQTLNDKLSAADTFFYCIEAVDADSVPTGAWEVGLGTYSGAHVFARTTVLESSNSDNAVNFAAGTKRVFSTIPGDRLPSDSGVLITAAAVSDTAYASSWNAVTTIAPSKNATYDKLESIARPAFVAGNWYTLPTGVVFSAQADSAANTIYWSAFQLDRLLTVSDLGTWVAQAQASSNCRLAIYAHDDSTGYPGGAALAATGDISTASTGAVSGDVTGANVALSGGSYWIAVWTEVANLRFMTAGNSGLTPTVLFSGRSTIAGLTLAQSGLIYLTSAETFSGGSWPNAGSESFTDNIAGGRGYMMLAKAA